MIDPEKGRLKQLDSRNFIKELATYYMDFLETDFHKRKSPKRNIQFRSANNLLIGLNLNKYPSFNSSMWKAILNAFDTKTVNKIEKNSYRTKIRSGITDIIKLQIEQINEKRINDILDTIALEIGQATSKHEKDYDQALSSSLESAINTIKKELVVPFIGNLDKPILNLDIGDKNNIYLMEEELTSVLVNLLQNKITEILSLLLAKENCNISKQLQDVFNSEDIKASLLSFFENLQVGDLFSEIYEMERNRTILDKQELYLYFGDISYKNVKYPIFYIPFAVNRQKDALDIQFDSQIFINKKALEYITQEFNQEFNKRGSLRKIAERIIYITQHKDDLHNLLEEILSEITTFFELDKNINLSDSEPQIAKSLRIRVTNNCYLALFDKSDEALINDYEEILRLLSTENNLLTATFNKLIDDFINNNPIPFNPGVEDEWDNTETCDRLVSDNPIPLNSEQKQILSAIKNENCKYIIVEGPPGTGKSHTITAIAFNAILNNQSVLILSDKKEALDVVEDKITETMDTVRHDKNFQNPILRLGKTGNTYSQILATNAVENIKTHYRAVKNKYDILEQNIDKLQNTLKEDIQAEILAGKEIDLREIKELFEIESYYKAHGIPVDVEEVLAQPECVTELEEFRRICFSLKEKLAADSSAKTVPLLKWFDFSTNRFSTIEDLIAYLEKLTSLTSTLKVTLTKIKGVYGHKLSAISMFNTFTDKDIADLTTFIKLYQKEKNWLFGYLFKTEQVARLNVDFKKRFELASPITPHQSLAKLKDAANLFSYACELKPNCEKSGEIKYDYSGFIHEALINEATLSTIADFLKTLDDLKYLKSNLDKYPATRSKLLIDFRNTKTLWQNELVKMSDSDFDKLVRFITLRQQLEKNFNNLPQLNYAAEKKTIEELSTARTTYLLDERLIRFVEFNKTTARTLKTIITTKQRFPKDVFLELKQAFPCIIAGIRDYAEYIPLEPEIFDLIIIDEASQVSIAQAFPALLRGKKVLILGDKKQFSNVKTSQARTDTNKEYLNNLEDCFRQTISDDNAKLVKLEKFNIKTSILDFFTFISNYNTQLLKHFRGYKEIISYSNRYFYQNSLQVMKIRGKPIEDVLKFTFINHDGKKELHQNTNSAEVEFIISELIRLKQENCNQSVGIITPHTNQQKLLMEEISKNPEKDYFFDTLKLKIMTFDTCQGEERDIIYYSLVATEEDDKLWGVFIKDLGQVDIEEDGQIKAQRLNVGLSRARESIHLVLSKPIDKYTGSIGEAIRHYYHELEEAKKEHNPIETDPKSKMEPVVMHWFYQTDFWLRHKEDITFMPQFEIGKYLKQLDKTYDHPKYKVDFLLIYRDATSKDHKIIIEYDGFEGHFEDNPDINEFNYSDYYTDADIYREKVLESYGYQFLRINRFNAGKNPVDTLNQRIEKLANASHKQSFDVLNQIHETIEDLQNGQKKECPKCKELRDTQDFRDTSLVTGYGRFCKFCKQKPVEKNTKTAVKAPPISHNAKVCPKCGSKMSLKNGRYGRFYGCSRYPYCKGIRPA